MCAIIKFYIIMESSKEIAQNISGKIVDVPMLQIVESHMYSFFFCFVKRGEFAFCFITIEEQKAIKADAKHKNDSISRASKPRIYLLNI